MKILLALICVTFLSAQGEVSDNDNLTAILEEVVQLQTSWQANTEIPSDSKISSFKELLGVIDDRVLLGLPFADKLQLPDSAIPREFDARIVWPHCPTIGEIKDQGKCGSCWALATASVFSDRLCIASNASFTRPLSEEEVLSCCGTACGKGCDGGNPFKAWVYMKKHGIVTGGGYNSHSGCQPYSIPSCEHHTVGNLPQCSSFRNHKTPQCKSTCTNRNYTSGFKMDHHKCERIYIVRKEVNDIQKELMTHGPVTAVIDVYSDFIIYKTGVYQHIAGKYLGKHAVRIIGWGTTGNSTDYWLVANSWNTHWGEKGFIKILRKKSGCEIEKKISACIPRN